MDGFGAALIAGAAALLLGAIFGRSGHTGALESRENAGLEAAPVTAI